MIIARDYRPAGVSETAVEAAPGLWRTNLQHRISAAPGARSSSTRVEITPDSPPVRHYHHGEEVICAL